MFIVADGESVRPLRPAVLHALDDKSNLLTGEGRTLSQRLLMYQLPRCFLSLLSEMMPNHSSILAIEGLCNMPWIRQHFVTKLDCRIPWLSISATQGSNKPPKTDRVSASRTSIQSLRPHCFRMLCQFRGDSSIEVRHFS